MQKIDTRNYHLTSLMALITANSDLKIKFIEYENWEQMVELINANFTYSQDQLEHVRFEFNRRHSSEIKPSLLTKK